MAALPVEILLGLYLGLLTGIIPALVAWSLGFLFKYFTGVSVPALAVVVLGVALAGANGGLLALVDPTVTTHPNAERVVVAIIVVMMMSLYAHSQGDKLGAAFPRRISLRRLRDRTLSSDVVELVGGRGQVRVRPVGDIHDIEGYPPLSPDVRQAIAEDEWTFPADLPLEEIERRLEDRLRTRHHLAEVAVTLDERARAEISAAPGSHGVSARIPSGRRAVSVDALVPTGLARGDEVTVLLEDDRVTGTIVSAQSGTAEPASVKADPVDAPDQADDGATRRPPRAKTTSGGEGRVTLAVSRADADRLLQADTGHLVVNSRGVRGEFQLLGLLRQAGTQVRKQTVGADSELAGTSLADAALRDAYGVEVLAIRTNGGWNVAPRGATVLAPGAELFVVGSGSAVERFKEALA